MNKARLLIFIAVLITLLSGAVQAEDTPAFVDLTDENLIGTLSVDYANLRSGPGTANNIVGSINATTRLSIVGMLEQNGERWYMIELPSSQRAWVAGWLLQVQPGEISASLVPQSSTLYISLDTRPGIFERIDDLFTIYNGGASSISIKGDIDRMIGLLFVNPLLTAQEVRPWLGNEVSVVNLQCLSTTMSDFLMSEELLETPRPSVVIMASVVDSVAAQAFIEQTITSGSLANAPRQNVNYNGYQYYLLNDPSQPNYDPSFPPVAMGLVNDYAVFTQGAASYNAIIDTANGAPSLASAERFTDVYSSLVNDSFLKVYVGPGLFCPVHEPILYETLLSELYRDGQIDLPGVDPDDPEALQARLIQILDETFKGYAVGFRDAGGQLAVDLATDVDRERLQELTGLPMEEIEERVGESGFDLFGFLAPEALQVLTLGNLQSDYDTLRRLSASTPEDMFEDATGISQNMLDWFYGTITMGFIDYPVFAGGAPADHPSYFLMVVETSSNELATESATNFAEAALLQAGAEVETVDVDGVSITRVTTGIGEVVEFGVIDQYVLLATGGNINRVIANGRQTLDGRFVPDWRLLAGLPELEERAAGNPDQAPFLAAMNLGRMALGATSQLESAGIYTQFSKPADQVGSVPLTSNVDAAAIITPYTNGPNDDDLVTLITIICQICNTEDCIPG